MNSPRLKSKIQAEIGILSIFEPLGPTVNSTTPSRVVLHLFKHADKRAAFLLPADPGTIARVRTD
jgi:hypothetical protein